MNIQAPNFENNQEKHVFTGPVHVNCDFAMRLLISTDT
jgi:hypothetical protein